MGLCKKKRKDCGPLKLMKMAPGNSAADRVLGFWIWDTPEDTWFSDQV